MEIKTYTGGLEIKQEGDQGLVRAVFATLNVIDKDGDVTVPGAFGDQRVRLAAWGHGSWTGGRNALPVGKGRIFEDGDKAIFEGGFFLDTETGREHFQTVKNLGDLQEWSYGFRIVDSGAGEFEGQQVRFLKKMRVPEVSPVLEGAGVETVTVDIKGADGLKVWEETENEIRHRLRDPGDFEPGSFRRITIKRDKPRVFAIIGHLKGETTTTVQALRFPKDDGWTVASAKKWVADHPDIAKSSELDGLTLAEDFEMASISLADVRAVVKRAGSLADLRAMEARKLSEDNRERLAGLLGDIAGLKSEIEELLTKTEPDAAKLRRLHMDFLRITAGID